MKERLVDRYFNEKIVCGGVLFTRKGLYDDLKKQGYTGERLNWIIGLQKEASQEEIAGAVNEIPNVYPPHWFD